jgi:hypothetical protein
MMESHFPVFPSAGVMMMVWPRREGMVGPNMG